MNKEFYLKTGYALSRLLTNRYSTSFSLGIRVFPKRYQDPIYAIYGFVRIADEIVDTFDGQDKKKLLDKIHEEIFAAIRAGVSTNPILHAFQDTVNQYKIDLNDIDAFLHSMEMDLTITRYDRDLFDEYVYGSAEVVGLMCLKVFCEKDEKLFESLRASAKKLGAAFQKVNFLRDLKSDIDDRGRIYLPNVQQKIQITNEIKKQMEAEVEKEFVESLSGIKLLPQGARLGVYSAYLYYQALLEIIKRKDVAEVLSQRLSVSSFVKFFLLLKAFVTVRFFWR